MTPIDMVQVSHQVGFKHKSYSTIGKVCKTPSHYSCILYTINAQVSQLGNKTQYFEVTMVNTRQGKRLKHAPVKETLSIPSPSSSPSKKHAWSPEVLDVDDSDGAAEQILKWTRTTGKMFLNVKSKSDTFSQTQNDFLNEYLTQ